MSPTLFAGFLRHAGRRGRPQTPQKRAWDQTASSVPPYSRQAMRETIDDARDAARYAAGQARANRDERRRKFDLTQYTSKPRRLMRKVAQKGLLTAVVRSQLKVDVRGKENFTRPRGSFIVVANHSSHLDTALIHSAVPWKMAGVIATGAAGDYFYSKVLVRLATQLFFNTYPIDRTGKGKAAGLSSTLVDHGIPLLIYPEGTRSRTGEMARFKPGAAALCVTRRVPAIPIALIGAYDAMPPGRSWPKSGRPAVKVLIGRPIMPRRDERIREFNDRISAHVAAMKQAGTNHVLVAADRAPAPRATITPAIREEAS